MYIIIIITQEYTMYKDSRTNPKRKIWRVNDKETVCIL